MVAQEGSGEKKLMCFVKDEETSTVLKDISFEDFGLSAEIEVGDVPYAVEYIKKNGSPHILLIDLSDVDLPISQIELLAGTCEPHTEILSIGTKNEVGLFRDLIHLGVRDYLVKPIPKAIFVRTLQEITQKSRGTRESGFGSKAGKIIAVLGATGGIGVSSLVANLGVGLAEKKLKRVALFDLDFQLGTLFQYLDIEKNSGLPQLFELPDRVDPAFIERYMIQYSNNLRILNAEYSLKDQIQLKPEAVEPVLHALSSRFHFILLDMPRPFSSEFHLECLRRANTIMAVTDYSLTSLKNLNYMLEFIKDSLRANQEIIIVSNKKNQYQDGEIDKDLFEETLDHKVNFDILFDNKYPLKALKDGIPAVNEESGNFVKGIGEVLSYIVGGQQTATLEKRSFFDKILSRING